MQRRSLPDQWTSSDGEVPQLPDDYPSPRRTVSQAAADAAAAILVAASGRASSGSPAGLAQHREEDGGGGGGLGGPSSWGASSAKSWAGVPNGGDDYDER